MTTTATTAAKLDNARRAVIRARKAGHDDPDRDAALDNALGALLGLLEHLAVQIPTVEPPDAPEPEDPDDDAEVAAADAVAADAAEARARSVRVEQHRATLARSVAEATRHPLGHPKLEALADTVAGIVALVGLDGDADCPAELERYQPPPDGDDDGGDE